MKPRPKDTDWIDIHSHQTDGQEGVFRIFNLFLEDFHEDVSFGVFSCGLHPWHIQQYGELENFPRRLEEVIRHEKMVAIGEAGLDKVIPTEMEVQEEVFKRQVELSESYQLPVIIHCVKAFHILLKIRNEMQAKQPWILHGFNSNPQLAADLIEKGIYISGGLRMLRSKAKCREILERISPDFLFAETDDDDEKDISEVYAELAECMGMNSSELKEIIYRNYNKIFLKNEDS